MGGVVGTVGLVFYGVLRLDHALFYEQLGVKPEEVGLGYAEILSQSATGVILVVILFFVFLSLFVFAYGLFLTSLLRDALSILSSLRPKTRAPQRKSRARETKPTDEKPSPWSYVAALGRLAALAGVVVLMIYSSAFRTAIVIAMACLTYGAVILVEIRRKDSFLIRRWRTVTVAVALFALVGGLSLLSLSAWEDGRAVQQGKPRHASFGPIPIGGWGADFATISTSEAAVPGPMGSADKCLLFLGESNDKAIFYDPEARQSLRIPSSNLVITVHHPPDRAPAFCSFGQHPTT